VPLFRIILQIDRKFSADLTEARMTIKFPRNNFRGLSRRRFLSTAAAKLG
jgi:hypothetical protein